MSYPSRFGILRMEGTTNFRRPRERGCDPIPHIPPVRPFTKGKPRFSFDVIDILGRSARPDTTTVDSIAYRGDSFSWSTKFSPDSPPARSLNALFIDVKKICLIYLDSISR